MGAVDGNWEREGRKEDDGSPANGALEGPTEAEGFTEGVPDGIWVTDGPADGRPGVGMGVGLGVGCDVGSPSAGATSFPGQHHQQIDPISSL
mmetsp:Transcript_29919/g.69026  ORF Transcript_29919/g.69026 Transcript_29919/m.69026 type:complete len:92 (-) Transcript_29919:258-533(-)